MNCQKCNKDMDLVGKNHFHCQECGECHCNGIRFQFFMREEETYCPQDKDWKKDPFFKTGGLA